MRKVINIYISDKSTMEYSTGLILELEDGTYLEQCSTDFIVPFHEISKEEFNQLKNNGNE